MIIHGFDKQRDKWSIENTERLFPSIVPKMFHGGLINIDYTWGSELDKFYGVDAIIITKTRNIALALRIRGVQYYEKYSDVTIRYDSLQTLGKSLEISKSIARFIFIGWVNTDRPIPGDRFVGWCLVDLQRLVDKYLDGIIHPKAQKENDDRSSRFIAFDPYDLQKHQVLVKADIHTKKCSITTITPTMCLMGETEMSVKSNNRTPKQIVLPGF